MPNRTYKHFDLLACDSCGREWFGAGGEMQARDHARQTGHQVRIEFFVRETLNEVPAGQFPDPVPQVTLTAAQRQMSRNRAVTRLKRAGVEI